MNGDWINGGANLDYPHWLVSALREQVADLGQELDVGRRFRLWLCLLLLLQLDHRPDNEEEHERDDDEVERDGQELPIAQDGALLLGLRVGGGLHLARKRDEVVREIEPTGDRADDRHDDIAD